jgi:hypothetical protein
MTEPNGMTYMTQKEMKILKSVAKNPTVVAQMENPSEEFLLSAVFDAPYIIRFVHNQSFRLRLLAVKLDWRVLRYVNGQTPEILLVAAARNERGVIGADLTHDEIEIYANAQNIKKFGAWVAHSR